MNLSRQHSLLATLALLASTTAQAQLFTDHFDYANGDIATVSGGNWVKIGTDSVPLNISNHAAIINQGDATLLREDVGRALGATLTPTANNTAFVGFNATWTTLPSNNNGSYFAVFSTAPTSATFFGRIGADLQGAAAGKFRISVANANWNIANSVEFSQDLSLNTTYHVVVRYDLAAKQTTLWIDPTGQTSASVTATDAVTTQSNITAFALRQGLSAASTTSPGVIRLDDLVVGTTFVQVTPVPEPAGYAALAAGGLAIWALLRRRSVRSE